MDKRILVDVGSSTVKVYQQQSNSLSLLFTRSIPFKTDFDPVTGISEPSKSQLYGLMTEVRSKNPETLVNIYATALFRRFDQPVREAFIDEFFVRTGLYFNIIPQELESFYLQVALAGKYKGSEPVLLVNIGGGSTELVVMCGKEAVEVKNVDLGVGTILAEFSNINNVYSGVAPEKVKQFVLSRLPTLDNKMNTALYSGGELQYMQLASYELEPNHLFRDKDHPFMISLGNFTKRNN